MTLYTKRVLIIFSVCLNLGFIIYAGFVHMADQDVRTGHKGRFALTALERLDLPAAENEKARRRIEAFQQEARTLGNRSKEMKLDQLKLLAARDFDPKAFAEGGRLVDRTDLDRNARFRAHALAMREALGPEYATRYFGMILDEINARRSKKN